MVVTFEPDPRLAGRTELVLETGAAKIVLKRLASAPTKGQLEDTGSSFSADLAVPFASVLASQRALRAAAASTNQSQFPRFKGGRVITERKLSAVQDNNVPIVNGLFSLVSRERSLMITDPSVLTDPARTFEPCTNTGTPMGAWTFGALMKNMAGPTDPADFAQHWVDTMTQASVANTFPIAPGSRVAALQAWPRDAHNKLDLAKAPFRLMAIVNRIDLVGNVSYGSVGGAEARFIFRLLDPGCVDSVFQFNVILEYGVPIDSCIAIQDWAEKWLKLGTIALGSATFDPELQKLTDVFTAPNADPTHPNGSAIDRIRTNEDVGGPWRLREYHVLNDGFFHSFPVAQTPQKSQFNNTATLGNWLLANPQPAEVPVLLGSVRFQGGSATNEFHLPWTAPLATNAAIHDFALNTCDGCHGPETGAVFQHVEPGGGLSTFLTGGSTVDPRGEPVTYHFHELQDRAVRLQTLANGACGRFRPVPNLLQGLLFPNPLPPIEFQPSLSAD